MTWWNRSWRCSAVQLEDARELLDRRIDDRDLVRNAAQERLVGKDAGSRFVAKTMRTSNGTWNFLPVWRVR